MVKLNTTPLLAKTNAQSDNTKGTQAVSRSWLIRHSVAGRAFRWPLENR